MKCRRGGRWSCRVDAGVWQCAVFTEISPATRIDICINGAQWTNVPVTAIHECACCTRWAGSRDVAT